jgi:hypothetical protein
VHGAAAHSLSRSTIRSLPLVGRARYGRGQQRCQHAHRQDRWQLAAPGFGQDFHGACSIHQDSL